MKSYQLKIEDIEKKLVTSIKDGLSESEQKKRLEESGPNKIEEKRKFSILKILLSQFLSPLMYVLFIAAIASLLIREFTDAIVIGIAVLINVIVGFIQEFRAERAIESLKKYEVSFCEVRRDGKNLKIESEKLVPGDIVLLAAGARIPADIRITNAIDFSVEEAILTGESKAIKKVSDVLPGELVVGDRINMAHSGTYVVSGKAEGIVVETGKNTEIGKIAKMIVETEQEDTPLQQQIKRFSWILGWLMLAITLAILGLGILRGIAFLEIVGIAIALAVAAIPEGLLVAVTVVLAVGMQRMLKRKALVRHLIAAETLGSVSIICTDKTGTLTEGRMALSRIVTQNNDIDFRKVKELPEDVNELLIAGILNNDAEVDSNSKRIGSPTEIALLEAAINKNIDIESIKKNMERVDETPFSSDLKYMATVHKLDGSKRLIVKGAPEEVLEMCDSNSLKNFSEKAEKMTSEGLRVLAFAFKDSDSIDLKNDLHGLTFMGLVGLHDPLREDAVSTIKELTGAGIKTIVVTGDHKDTALNISRGAGILVEEGGVMTGKEVNGLSVDELKEKVADVNVFARVDPRHKIKIVDAWKKRGHSVAMIGDGVNDAPAIKSADVGVSLGSGSDVAHEISDMVLLENNLSVIDAAVREGRIIFDNIRKIIVYLMADSFSEVILIAGAILIGLQMPLLAVQILWINLVTDGFPYMALTLEPGEPEIMKEKPREKNEPVMNTEIKVLIFVIGIITDIGLFGLYLGLLKFDFDLQHIRTIIFTALAIDSLLYVFSVRSLKHSIFRVNPLKNMWLNIAVVFGFLIQLAVIYIKPMQTLFSTVYLGLNEWMIILVLSMVKIVAIEATKEIFFVK